MGTGGGLVVIDFSEHGNNAHFLGAGWSGQEAGRVWAIGPRSVLCVPFQSAGRPFMLEAELGPCHAPLEIEAQIVHVRVNGAAVGGVRLNALSVLRCEVDPALARHDGKLEIEFECPGFYVPAGLGGSGDRRPLSCWFTFVRIYTTDMFSPGPHFPASEPGIPEIAVAPPFADAHPRVAPEIYTFGLSQTALPAAPDPSDNEFSVTEGCSAQLKLLAPRTPGNYVLRVDARPLVACCASSHVETTIALEGVVIGQISVGEPSAWVMALPRELTEKRDVLRLNFRLRGDSGHAVFGPCAAGRPNGIAVTRVGILPVPGCLTRTASLRAEQAGVLQPIAVSDRFLTESASALPAAIEAVLGVDTITLLRGFESLGTGREFADMQQKLGLEVLNLFGFCEATFAGVIDALTDDLKAAADSRRLTFELNDAGRRVLSLRQYNLRWPVFASGDDVGEDVLRDTNAVTLGYLRRKFYEGLQAGRKIYVVQQRRQISVAEAAVLLMEPNRQGTATLLCVSEAHNEHLPGEAELLWPGLMRGYVERPAPGSDAAVADPTDWLRVLANATLLQRMPAAIVVP